MKFPIFSALLIGILLAPAVVRAHGPCHHNRSHCRDCAENCARCSDRTALSSVTGTISEIGYFRGGTVEAKLNTSTGEQWVRLAAATFLKQNDFRLKEGDALTASGYIVEGLDGPMFVATEIRVGDRRLVLRGRQGRGPW